MMITTPREADAATKQERNTVDHDIEKNQSKAKPSSSITSTPRSRLRDPRIVRVSRALGRKDRHSKVCTVKGLIRDRRVRLSVPTAIQLYDLQERLGLNQPSKVVDWLLNAAKHDIDELPPLQMPLGNFGQNDHDHDDQVSLTSSTHGVVVDSSRFDTKGGVQMINSSTTVRWESSFGNMDKSKEVIAIAIDPPGNEEGENGEAGENEEEEEEADVSANKFFPRSNYVQCSSIPGLLNNVLPYNSSIYRWDPSIFSLSQFTVPQPDHDQDHPPNFNVDVPLPLLSSLPPGSQVLVCPTGTTQPYFPPHEGATDSVDDFGPKQINHFQMLSSSTTSQNPNFPSSMKAFQLSMSPDLHH